MRRRGPKSLKIRLTVLAVLILLALYFGYHVHLDNAKKLNGGSAFMRSDNITGFMRNG